MSYTRLLYHIVFRPKNSRPAITPEHEELLYRYIWRVLTERGCKLFCIGGMADHIHMLVGIPPTLAVADFMRDVKTSTSRFMHIHSAEFPLFEAWGKSYCAISCSESVREDVTRYIKNQKEHHRRQDFRSEFLDLLRKNGVDFDMKYFLKE